MRTGSKPDEQASKLTPQVLIPMADLISSPPCFRLPVAAQYLRMSTEHQQYSIANQSAAIALYAAAHGIAITQSFVDAGKSGTTIKGRKGLQELLRVVQSGQAEFGLILVYDVSRLGRFPDADEAAHYEYLCKRAGITIRYCAEQFENDNSMTSNLLKALKRTMASEYSRELSVKVLTAQCHLAQLGFRMGGGAAYGLRRLLIDKSGKVKRILVPGEHKELQTDRVVLVPGDEREIQMIRRIFDLFTKGQKTKAEIVKILNAEGLLFRGHIWIYENVNRLLQNPAYVGTNTFCRWRISARSGRMKANAEENWIKRDGAFPPILAPGQFQKAKAILALDRERFTKQAMLEALGQLLKEKGTLSTKIIQQAKGMPRPTTYYYKFGGLLAAYRLIGFKPHANYSRTDESPSLKARRADLLREIASQIQAAGGSVSPGTYQTFRINNQITARLKFSRPLLFAQGRTVWPLFLTHKRLIDILIIARLESEAPFRIFDYFVVPSIAKLKGKFCIRARNNIAFLDLYRMNNLKMLIKSFGRTSTAECAL